MNHYLVKFAQCWADEFDCQQMSLYKGTDPVTVAEHVRIDWNRDGEIYFGTNEYFEYDEVADAFTVEKITEEQYNTLFSLLGSKFGTGIL